MSGICAANLLDMTRNETESDDGWNFLSSTMSFVYLGGLYHSKAHTHTHTHTHTNLCLCEWSGCDVSPAGSDL